MAVRWRTSTTWRAPPSPQLLGTSSAVGSAMRSTGAIFNIIIYGIVGMYAFYNGYKGLATNSRLMTDSTRVTGA